MLKILTFSTLFPNAIEPHHGIFTETSLRQQRASGAVEAVVVAPVPWFPSSASLFGRYGRYARVPREEVRDGVRVLHPRYLNLPFIGMHLAPFLMAAAARKTVANLIGEGYEFEVIDAHYFYPDGVAAALLARHFDKPVIVSALGSDITLLPRFRWPRRLIRWTAGRAAAMISVCEALKTEMGRLGLAGERIHALRNGVDLDVFYPEARDAARQRLGYAGYTLLSVGHLVPRKGHDKVIGALADLPDVRLVIVGDGPERQRLQSQARQLGVADRVSFAGLLSQDALRSHYSAADALVLASSREGWANVLLEAMACGTPALASNVWGTPEVVSCHAAGRLLAENSAAGVADAVRALRADSPARGATRAHAERYSWAETCRAQVALFAHAAAHHSPSTTESTHADCQPSARPEAAL